jgi:hypothetical protein
MIRACFFEELLEVVLRRSCLVLVVALGLYSMISARATRSLVDAAVIIGYGLLAVQFAPLLAGHGAFLGTLDGDARKRFPAADRGWLKSCRLGTSGAMGGEATPSFGGALGGIS